MRDERRRSSTASSINKLLTLMTCGLQLHSGVIELVVELTRNHNSEIVFRYYFVDHPNRLLFWLHEIPTARIFDGVSGRREVGPYQCVLLQEQISQHFRQHCELYPSDKLPGPQLLKELKEVVVYANAEIITTDLSLSPSTAMNYRKFWI
ncbi:hypothetical protein BDR07DRAFT_1408786 [Suillus spraguei]|nr:hypothetical protein BDR07DRAFT_1408786 [Suillus spraguei]